ncbi:MAG TPA: hypothetical protein VF599_24775 [Pyrinomonadaceae bacterium]|jgi:hypothetical protein
MTSFFSIKHQFGVLIFTGIITAFVLAEVAHKIPYVNTKLPYRHVVIAKKPIDLYQCENFSRRNKIGVLETGEIADLEKVVCGDDTRWYVRLADGREACYPAYERDNGDHKLYNFYYF